MEHGGAGYAFENSSGDRWGDEFIAKHKGDIHGADFLDVLLFDAIEPQHLGKTVFMGFFAGEQTTPIIPRGFGSPGAAAHGPYIAVFHPDAERFEALGIIGSNGRENNKELVGVRRSYPQVGITRKSNRPDIQRGAGRTRHPVPVQFDQLFERREKEFRVNRRDAQPDGGTIKTGDIAVRSEE